MATRMSAGGAAQGVGAPIDPESVGGLPAPSRARASGLRSGCSVPSAFPRGDGRPVPIASQRAQSLLACLALNRTASPSRRQVSFLLWPDSTEAQAHNSLRQLLHQLRRAWPDADAFLSAHDGVLALEPGTGSDGRRRRVRPRRRGRRRMADDAADPATARGAYERAADLYAGALLPGFDDEWILAERERLATSTNGSSIASSGCSSSRATTRAAIERAEQRLRLDPLDERVYRWLMRLHALNQDRAGAFRVYQACVSLLARSSASSPILRPARRTSTCSGWARATPTAATRLGQAASPPSLAADKPRTVTTGRTAAGMGPDHGGLGPDDRGPGAVRGHRRRGGHRQDRGWRPSCAIGPAGATSAGRTRAYAAEGRLSFAPIADWLREPVARVGAAAARRRLAQRGLAVAARAPRPAARPPRPSARIEDWQRQAFFQALRRPSWPPTNRCSWSSTTSSGATPTRSSGCASCSGSIAARACSWSDTVRPDEIDAGHPATTLMAALRDDGQLTEIALGPLGPAETSSLAAQVFGRALRPEQSRRIHLETEGNPLFVVETVRAGWIDAGGGRERRREASDAAPTPRRARRRDERRLPPKVQAVIAARLAQLTEPARDLASLAATVGRAFTLEVIRESGSDDEDRLVAGMDELLRRQIVREQGDGAYDFTHDRLREVAYAGATEARRRLLHRRVADALERLHATDLDAVAAQIAGHCANAGLADRGAAFYQRAAEVAQQVGANLEAIGLLQRGLALLGHGRRAATATAAS